MSHLSRHDSAESDSSSYDGPASPTLVDAPLEEFPPPRPGAFLSRRGVPRLLTPAPHAAVPAGPATAENHILALGQMSPRSVRAAIASHNLPADTYRSIINGLVVTSEARTHRYNQDLAAQEADHKKKLDDHEETIEFLEARLVGYIDTFSRRLLSPSAEGSQTRPNGSRSSMMVEWRGIPPRTALTTSRTYARSMPPPSIQLTLQSPCPTGFTKPFRGPPPLTPPSSTPSKPPTTGGSRPMLCNSE